MCLQHLIYLPIYIFIISIKRILFVKIGKCICELNIVIEDLAFSELVSDRAFRLILGALLLCRYGEVVLNLERKTEEIT